MAAHSDGQQRPGARNRVWNAALRRNPNADPLWEKTTLKWPGGSADLYLGKRMIRVSDYIVRRLEEWGVEHVFLLTGGGAMFLNDSFARAERIQPICNHHEQACAMAAEGYARITGK